METPLPPDFREFLSLLNSEISERPTQMRLAHVT